MKHKDLVAQKKLAALLMRFHTVNPISKSKAFMTYAEISTRLHLSYNTVKDYCWYTANRRS